MANTRIWRFAEPLAERMTFALPAGARILTVRESRKPISELEVWAAVDPAREKEPRELVVVGTGHRVPADIGEFLGSTFFQGGAFVWHVFEVARG